MNHALAIVTLVALQAAMGSLRLSDAARVYGRKSLIDDGATLEIENAPRLELGLAWPVTTLELDYSPRLAWVDVLGDEPSPTLVLHSGSIALGIERPRYTLTLTQTGSYGDQDFLQSGLAGLTAEQQPPQPAIGPMVPDAELVPSSPIVHVASAETSANLRYLWSRRWTSELQAAFGFSGGSDLAAQRVLPRQRTAEVDVSVAYARSRRDRLTSAWSGAQIHTSNGFDHWLATLLESWSMRWTAATSSELALGAAFQDSSGPEARQDTEVVPVGNASVGHVIRARAYEARLSAGVGYGPDLNVIAGTLQNRLSGSVQAVLTTDRTSVGLTLSAAQSFPTGAPDAARLLSAALAFDRDVLEWLSLQAGGQITRQRFGGAGAVGADTFTIWLVYAGLEAQLPELRFRCC